MKAIKQVLITKYSDHPKKLKPLKTLPEPNSTGYQLNFDSLESKNLLSPVLKQLLTEPDAKKRQSRNLQTQQHSGTKRMDELGSNKPKVLQRKQQQRTCSSGWRQTLMSD